MHIGYLNHQTDYFLQGDTDDSTGSEEILKIVIAKDFKFSNQCIEIVK